MAVKRSEDPHDRLTQICNDIAKKVSEHPQFSPDLRCIVMCVDDKGGGIGAFGYDVEHEGNVGDATVITDLFLSLRAMLRANGKELQVMAIGGTPENQRE
jgi:hypothetical protein